MLMIRVVRAPLLLAAAAVTVGCAGDGVSGPATDASYMLASFNGAFALEFEGSGHFHDGVDPRRPAAPAIFAVTSTGRGSNADRMIQFYRQGAGLPEPGVYALGTGTPFRASYQRLGSRGETLESFAAGYGVLEITEAGAQRITGTFRFRAFRTCHALGNGAVTCVSASQPDPAAPTVEVTGSFVALPIARGGFSIR